MGKVDIVGIEWPLSESGQPPDMMLTGYLLPKVAAGVEWRVSGIPRKQPFKNSVIVCINLDSSIFRIY